MYIIYYFTNIFLRNGLENLKFTDETVDIITHAI